MNKCIYCKHWIAHILPKEQAEDGACALLGCQKENEDVRHFTSESNNQHFVTGKDFGCIHFEKGEY